MAIKVTVSKQKTQKEKPFPKLMKFEYTKDSYVILFMRNKNIGMCLHIYYDSSKSMSGDKVGDIWDNVNASGKGWSDYNEPITLQNE